MTGASEPSGENEASPQDVAMRVVREILAAHLGVALEELDGQRSFRELGLDGAGAVVVATMLGQALARPIYPMSLFEYQTPDRLIAHFEAERERRVAPTADAREPASRAGHLDVDEEQRASERNFRELGIDHDWPAAR
jgi:acyl carrier protein